LRTDTIRSIAAGGYSFSARNAAKLVIGSTVSYLTNPCFVPYTPAMTAVFAACHCGARRMVADGSWPGVPGIEHLLPVGSAQVRKSAVGAGPRSHARRNTRQ